MDNIYLIGFMGTGKSTVGRQLAGEAGFRFLDLDEEIEKEQGRKIREIFAQDGEEYFRTCETSLLKKLAQSRGQVISCGGGTVLRPENVQEMKKSGIVVLLMARPGTVYERVRNRSSRPLLNGNMNESYIAEMMAKREPAYRNAADHSVATDGRSPKELAGDILDLCKNHLR